jgi:hypothetical protein
MSNSTDEPSGLACCSVGINLLFFQNLDLLLIFISRTHHYTHTVDWINLVCIPA